MRTALAGIDLGINLILSGTVICTTAAQEEQPSDLLILSLCWPQPVLRACVVTVSGPVSLELGCNKDKNMC